MIRAGGAALVLAAAASVHAADLTVAGLLLGAPIVTTPCAGSGPVIVSKVTCLTDVVQLGPDLWRATIVLPYGDRPAIVASERIAAYSKGGALVGLDFTTYGLATQESDLAALTRKYGAPGSVEPIAMQNQVGGQFTGILATWALPGLSVSYLSTMASATRGQVSVDLPAAAEVRAVDRARTASILNPRKL